MEKEKEDLREKIVEALEEHCSCKAERKMVVATADMGGRFNCSRCGNLVTGVSSIGHGKLCYECQRKGYCKWCGKKI